MTVTIGRSHAIRLASKAIRKVCRSKPPQHDSFSTICDLTPQEIETMMVEAVKAVLRSREGK